MSGEASGAHWQDPEHVARFIARMERLEGERRALFRLMARLAPLAADAPARILDLGAGYGALAAFLLEAFPRARAVLVDLSEAMRAEAERRLAPFAGRFRYLLADLSTGDLPPEARAEAPYDLAVSSLALHHLPWERVRALYGAVAQVLRPGGLFLNLDLVDPGSPLLDDLYDRLRREEEREKGLEPEPPPPGHRQVPGILTHLEWLRSAGFHPVDCVWKRLGLAMVAGWRPS